MFTMDQRAFVRSELLERAAGDPRISSAAITGSGAVDAEDQWSDIDLAFALAEGVELMTALSDWTAYMYDEHSAVHHLDVPSGAWLYRVFLLPGTLQVDLAFVPATEFRPLASTFKPVFGPTNEPKHFPASFGRKPHRSRMAVRPSRSKFHSAGAPMAGRIHGQRPTKSGTGVGVCSPRSSCGARSRDRSLTRGHHCKI